MATVIKNGKPSAKPASEELTGEYSATRWTSDSRDYLIGYLADKTVVKGPCDLEGPDSSRLVPKQSYRFFGRWEDHPKWGRQFAFVAFTRDMPHTREAVLQYLARELKGRSTGIGPSKIHQLYDAYGSDAVRKLRENPRECAGLLKIGVDQCHAAAVILEANAKIENTKIELVGLLAGKGFPRTTINDLIQKWGARAAAMIRRDAFLLLTHKFHGAGFSRCDQLYLSLGGDPEKMKRQVLCAWHGLNENGAGHTWHPIDVGYEAVRSRIAGVNIRPKKAVAIGIRSGLLATREDSSNAQWLADTRKAKNEAAITANLDRLRNATSAWPPVAHASLSPHQREQLAIATAGPIGMLIGTPGTGKTFTAAAQIQAVVDQHGEASIAIAAPTGKAAVRLTETMQRYGLDLQACTIHRLLQPRDPQRGHGTGDWGFYFGEKEKLPYHYLIVDESSMIETDLMASLLRACSTGTNLLFLGDPYQLPPVGHGAPLRDFLSVTPSTLPRGELTEIRRNEGLIVDICAAIKDGRQWRGAEKFDQDGNNLRVIPACTPVSIIHQLRLLFDSIIRVGRRDPIEDVQVLVALNEKSEMGRAKLNPFLQGLLNPQGQWAEGNKYRVGDKVICLKNASYPSATIKGPPERIFNGEQGRVLQVAPDATVMEFPDTGDGIRRIKIPVKSEFKTDFDLAYAITAHKSQGSEWPVVVVIGDEAAGRVASREWWYTAISRAKERCLIFSSFSTIGKQCRKVTLGDRKTFLRELIEPQATEEIEDQNESPTPAAPMDAPLTPSALTTEEERPLDDQHLSFPRDDGEPGNAVLVTSREEFYTEENPF